MITKTFDKLYGCITKVRTRSCSSILRMYAGHLPLVLLLLLLFLYAPVVSLSAWYRPYGEGFESVCELPVRYRYTTHERLLIVLCHLVLCVRQNCRSCCDCCCRWCCFPFCLTAANFVAAAVYCCYRCRHNHRRHHHHRRCLLMHG